MRICGLHILLMLFFFLFLSCGKETDEAKLTYIEGVGGLSLSTKALTEEKIPVITKSADFSNLSAADFHIVIVDPSGSIYKEYASYTAMLNDGFPLVLPEGENYKVIASSFKVGDTKVSNTPYFVDEQNFNIEEKKTTNVSLTCRFESLGVELNLSDRFKALIKKFPANYDYEVVVSNGEASYTFSKNEMKPAYFISGCDELIARVKVRLDSADTWYPERTYRIKNDMGSTETSPKVNEYYIINLDAGPETLSFLAFPLTEK